MLPLDSCPKVAVGQWIAWWSGLPRGSSNRAKLCTLPYHSCQICRTWGEILKLSYRGQVTKGWNHFYGRSWPLKTPCKDLNLTIVGGLGWMKWLKSGAGKSLYFMQLSMLESQSWKNKIVAEMCGLKLVTITITSLNFFNCPVKL